MARTIFDNLQDNELIRKATQAGMSVEEYKNRNSPKEPIGYIPDTLNILPDFLKPQETAPVDVATAQQAKPLNSIVKDYLTKKLEDKRAPSSDVEVQDSTEDVKTTDKLPSFMDQFSADEYKKAKDASTESNGELAIAQLLGGIGDAFAGRSADETAKRFGQFRNQIKENTVGDFEKRKKSAIEDYNTNRQLKQNQITDDQRGRDIDVNSEESKMARMLAVKMGMNPDVAKNLTAAKFKEMSPVLEKMYSVEQARLARQDTNASREEAKAAQRADKARLSESQLKEVQDFDDTITKAQSVISMLGNNSNYTGSYDGRVPDALVGSDQVAFRSAVGRMTDAYRKLITGAGASNQELARLEGRLPQPTDTFADFQAKAKSLIEETKRAKESHLKNLEYNGKNTEPFKSASKASKPKTVVQNGHTYTLNPETGEYE